jgi:hypothetical protein
MKPQAAHGVPDEARDAKAHVGGVAKEDQHDGYDADDKPSPNDRGPFLCEVHRMLPFATK